MRETNWIIKIIDRGFKTTRDVYIFRRLPDNTIEFVNGDIAKEGDGYEKPSIELDPEQLQALADELNNIGYKPQAGFLEGKIIATEKHLEDMRTLVFTINKLKV